MKKTESTAATPGELKQWALERWENEGGRVSQHSDRGGTPHSTTELARTKSGLASAGPADLSNTLSAGQTTPNKTLHAGVSGNLIGPCKGRALVKLMRLLMAFLGSLALFVPAAALGAATVEYDLTIAKQVVNFTGQSATAMTLNGQLPGPTLRFTEGDHAVIRVHNRMDVDTSIHWHGILLPNAMDGVPFLTYPPIAPGETFTYAFDLRQSGTYWYHSHTMLQEQRGLFGALVIAPKSAGELDQLRDHVVVLSDWTDEDASSVLHTLKRGSEWYSIRKGSGQSVLGAARLGLLGSYFSRELQRMPPMDLADVYYDRFLLNGAPQQSLAARPGEKIRLRVIAGSASTFFYLQFADGPMQVIAADGLPVQPFITRCICTGISSGCSTPRVIPRRSSTPWMSRP
jgi:FtsP/CotA-like multicopper oxidase with cupredoxin domain